MLWIVFRGVFFIVVAISFLVLLGIKVMNRDWKSFRKTLAIGALLSIPAWFLSRPVNPPLKRFDFSLTQPNQLSNQKTPSLEVGQSFEEVKLIMGCPPGKYGNPEFVTRPTRSFPHPMGFRPDIDEPSGTRHFTWEDDYCIIDCAFDAGERLQRWTTMGKNITFEKSQYVIQASRWLGLE